MTINKFRQLLGEWRGILITVPSVTLLIIMLRSLGVLQLLEWAALDQFFRWRPTEPMDDRIVLVEISESDIGKADRWPISDRTFAELLQKLKALQPRVIGLDIYRDLPVPPGNDRLLAVFKSTPNLIGITKAVSNTNKDFVATQSTLKQRHRVGASDIVLDTDGKVRRALLAVNEPNGKTIYSLSVELALMYLQKEGIYLREIEAESGKYSLGKAIFTRLTKNFGGYAGVDTGGYQILFNFRSRRCPPKKQINDCHVFKTVSITEVLENRISRELIRDRIVLIGSNSETVKDFFFTPYTYNYLSATPGVEIHAHLTSQIISAALNDRPLINALPKVGENLWILLSSSVGAILGFGLLRLRWKFVSILLVGGFLVGSAYIGFLFGWWIPVVPPLLALVGSGIVITGYINYIERQDRLTVMSLLGQHVGPKIAQAVWRDRHQLLREGQLLGKKITATVLFTDIKGFTTITEKTDPETLMFWLNDYMKVMSQVVLDCEGVVDKFIGDAVMAVFGVPIPSTTPEEIAQDAIAAVTCAVEMGKKLASLNQQWQQQGLPTVEMRVGIATGTVVTGSLGSHQRLNYTTIGDTVNIAARLESYDKSLEGGICRILIGEETYKYIEGKFTTQFIGCVQLKGREGSINIYQVIGD